IDLEGITENEIRNMKQLFQRFSLIEQGRLLQFLTIVNDGDVETNLLLLGFKGLDSMSRGSEDSANVITESSSDIKNENMVTAESKKEIAQERLHVSSESVKSATREIGIEEALDLFN